MMILDGYVVALNVENGCWEAEDPRTGEKITADTHAELLIKVDQKVHPERCSE